MPSTSPLTLGSLFKAFAKGATFKTNRIGRERTCTSLTLAATAENPIFEADGRVLLRRIVIIPQVAMAGHADNHWTLAVQNKGAVDGTGTTEVCTLTTDSDLAEVPLVAFKRQVLYAPAGDVELADGTVLSLVATKGGAAADLPLLVIVQTEPIIN